MKNSLLAGSAVFILGIAASAAAVAASGDTDQPLSFSLKGNVVENLGYAANNKLDESGTPARQRVHDLAEQDDATLTALAKASFGSNVSLSLQGDLYGTASELTRSSQGACDGVKPSAASSRCASNLFLRRAFATLSSPAGSLIVGQREDAIYILHNAVPDVSPLARSAGGYFQYWVVSPADHRSMTVDNDSRYDDRGVKISYISPPFRGVSGGLTYVPHLSSSTGSGSAVPATASDYGLVLPGGRVIGADYGGDAYGASLYYATSLEGVGIKADLGVLQASTANLQIWQQGIQVLYAGFTLAGSSIIRSVPANASINDLYSNQTAALLGGAGTTAAAVARAAVFAGNGYTIGLRYAIGPYSASVSYFHDNSKSLAALNGTGQADSTNFYDFGLAYDLGTPVSDGPRVTLRAGLGYVSYGGSVADRAKSWNNNNDGVVGVTGVRLDF
jgi:hypothetical protein